MSREISVTAVVVTLVVVIAIIAGVGYKLLTTSPTPPQGGPGQVGRTVAPMPSPATRPAPPYRRR